MFDLFTALYPHVSAIMALNDSSHDMTHITRVIRIAETILQREQTLNPHQQYNAVLVRCGALLHDVGDTKYALPSTYSSEDVSFGV